MVKQTAKNKNMYYTCEECEFMYKDKEMAEKCESWCREHHSCNLEFTKHAVEI